MYANPHIHRCESKCVYMCIHLRVPFNSWHGSAYCPCRVSGRVCTARLFGRFRLFSRLPRKEGQFYATLYWWIVMCSYIFDLDFCVAWHAFHNRELLVFGPSLSHIVEGGGLGVINTLLFLLVWDPQLCIFFPNLNRAATLEDVGLIGRTSVILVLFNLFFLLYILALILVIYCYFHASTKIGIRAKVLSEYALWLQRCLNFHIREEYFGHSET